MTTLYMARVRCPASDDGHVWRMFPDMQSAERWTAKIITMCGVKAEDASIKEEHFPGDDDWPDFMADRLNEIFGAAEE